MSDFKSKDVSLQIQKKILGTFAKKNVAKLFIDDTSASLLDNLHRLAKFHCTSKKEADKIVKNLIKVIIKIGVIHKNNQFTEAELKLAERLSQQLNRTVLTIVSFDEVAFSYDRNYLVELLDRCKMLLKELVNNHLTAKTLDRIERIFAFFTDTQLVDQFFRSDNKELLKLRGQIVDDINQLIENGAF